jgi:hypothetical protein
MAAPRRAALLLAALALAGCAAPARAALAAEKVTQWNGYIKDSLATAAGPKGAAAALQPVLSAHEFSTPLEAVQASNARLGSGARLRRVVSDLLAGKAVKVVAIGGVATNGSDASAPGKNDYFARYVQYLARAFPGASIKPVRSSVGLAPSSVVAGCLSQFLPADADLVILEMTATDGATMDSSIVAPNQPKAYEALVRKIMSGAKTPALILAQVRRFGGGGAVGPLGAGGARGWGGALGLGGQQRAPPVPPMHWLRGSRMACLAGALPHLPMPPPPCTRPCPQAWATRRAPTT